MKLKITRCTNGYILAYPAVDKEIGPDVRVIEDNSHDNSSELQFTARVLYEIIDMLGLETGSKHGLQLKISIKDNLAEN